MSDLKFCIKVKLCVNLKLYMTMKGCVSMRLCVNMISGDGDFARECDTWDNVKLL